MDPKTKSRNDAKIALTEATPSAIKKLEVPKMTKLSKDDPRDFYFVDAPLTVEGEGNWFLVVREDRHEFERMSGSAGEMRALARALRLGTSYFADRAAVVSVEEGSVDLWSPRNSSARVRVPLNRAQDLANKIDQVCQK